MGDRAASGPASRRAGEALRGGHRRPGGRAHHVAARRSTTRPVDVVQLAGRTPVAIAASHLDVGRLRGSSYGDRVTTWRGLVLGVTVPTPLEVAAASRCRSTSTRSPSSTTIPSSPAVRRSSARCTHRRQARASQPRTSCSQHPATRRSTVARRSWRSAPAGVHAGHLTSQPEHQSACTPPARQNPFMSGFVGTDVPTNPDMNESALSCS